LEKKTNVNDDDDEVVFESMDEHDETVYSIIADETTNSVSAELGSKLLDKM
jgi:hypothetical protein